MGRAWRGGRVRSIAAALKAAGPARGPGVRIPPPPSYEPSRPPPWPSRALPRFDRAAPAPAPPAPLAARHHQLPRALARPGRRLDQALAGGRARRRRSPCSCSASRRSPRRSCSSRRGSVALLADLIHNAGDAVDRDPAGRRLRAALRARRALGGARRRARDLRQRLRGRLRGDRPADRPARRRRAGRARAAGAIGFAGNWAAAIIRTRAGRRLDSPALVADGAHARADAYVSLAVIASAAALASACRPPTR